MFPQAYIHAYTCGNTSLRSGNIICSCFRRRIQTRYRVRKYEVTSRKHSSSLVSDNGLINNYPAKSRGISPDT